jgi:hypothetical protein
MREREEEPGEATEQEAARETADPEAEETAEPEAPEPDAPEPEAAAPDGLDRLAELDALLDLGRRAPGSDAERRASIHLRDRLGALGRDAELESFSAFPAWPLAYALIAAVGVAGSVLSVYSPAPGAALALAAALLLVLEAGLLIPLARRLFGRRASQNVVSWANPGKKPGALVLVAHLDAGRGGLVLSDRIARSPVTRAGLRPLLWALVAVLACAVLRVAGVDSTPLTVVQLIPTLALIVAVALLIDVALAGTRSGENDNASGCVLGLRLADRPPQLEHFDLHLLFTGANKAGCAGIRDFLRRHADRLPRESTVLLNLDTVGSGAVRYTRKEGDLLSARSHVQLTEVADQLVEDGFDAADLTSRRTSDGAVAASAGLAAITITCRDRADYASGLVTEHSLDDAEAFCAELIERLDAQIGPDLSGPR